MTHNIFRTMALLVISFDLVATVKVVVVGAGTSGLAAARTLIDTWDTAANGGPLELTVLEAGTRIGGRVWTLNAAEAGAAWDTAGALGAPTDMGASWIHGSNESHPITKIATALGLAENAGLVKTRNNLAELHLCTNGATTACPESNDDQYTTYKSLLAQAQQIADQQMGAVNGADISLWQALSGLSSSGQTRDSDLFQYNLASSAEFQTSGPVVNLSAVYWNDDSKYNGAELVWAQGYKTMYEALQSGAVRVNDGSSTLQVTGPPPPPPVCSDQINSGVLLEGGNPAPCSLFAPGSDFNSACSSQPAARQNCPVSCGTCPPPSPAPPGKIVRCTNACTILLDGSAGFAEVSLASDGTCADGGEGAESAQCVLGDDCDDCGPRYTFAPPPMPSTPPSPPFDPPAPPEMPPPSPKAPPPPSPARPPHSPPLPPFAPLLDQGECAVVYMKHDSPDDFAIVLFDHLSAGESIYATDAAFQGGCANTCASTTDGHCDDGGPGSETTTCAFGSDCTDCGSRALAFATGETHLTYTATAEVPAGSVLTVSHFSGAALSLESGGDEILIYRGSRAAPQFLCGFCNRAASCGFESIPGASGMFAGVFNFFHTATSYGLYDQWI